MQAEIVMIGTELLLGQIQDTNATYMGRTLAEHGINLYQKTTVGDNRARITAVLDAALTRSDVVLCSGGLGPTEDDITRECVAELLGRPLEYHPDAFEEMQRRFRHARFKITENNKKQGMRPQGSEFIPNPHGTAPGILVDDARGVVVCMPGVPHELQPMLEERVIPFLCDKFGLRSVLRYRVLKVCGMGESRVDDRIGDLVATMSNPTIGLLASPDAVRIRIAARADSAEEAEALIAPAEAQVLDRLPGLVMGRDDDTLEGVVDALFAERGWRLAVAETQSGGTVCQRLAASGAHAFAGGRVLPVSAVAGNSARDAAVDLASRLLVEYSADCALALIFDPSEKHTVAVLRTPQGDSEWIVGYYGTSARSQLRTAIIALEQVRRHLLGVVDTT